MKTWLDKAGPFKIARMEMPHFDQPITPGTPPMGVLHTTEGYWDAAMGVFHTHYAPQFIVGVNAHVVAATRVGHPLHPPEPSGIAEIAQMVPLGIEGAALRTHNYQAIAQIEVVAFSDEKPWIFPTYTLHALAALMATLYTECGIPLTRPWPDGTFGMAGRTAHRNDGHWGKTAGWYGHGDVPSPDTHWDPGNLQWAKVFDLAKTYLAKPAPTTPVA